MPSLLVQPSKRTYGVSVIVSVVHAHQATERRRVQRLMVETVIRMGCFSYITEVSEDLMEVKRLLHRRKVVFLRSIGTQVLHGGLAPSGRAFLFKQSKAEIQAIERHDPSNRTANVTIQSGEQFSAGK